MDGFMVLLWTVYYCLLPDDCWDGLQQLSRRSRKWMNGFVLALNTTLFAFFNQKIRDDLSSCDLTFWFALCMDWFLQNVSNVELIIVCISPIWSISRFYLAVVCLVANLICPSSFFNGAVFNSNFNFNSMSCSCGWKGSLVKVFSLFKLENILESGIRW